MAFIGGAVAEQRLGGFEHSLFSVSFGSEGLDLDSVNADAKRPDLIRVRYEGREAHSD